MRRAYLIALTLAATSTLIVLTLAVPLVLAAHAMPAPGARPYTSGSTSPWCTQWHIMSSPAPDSTFSYLAGVSADAATDIWAVGNYNDASGDTLTLVEHYDGTAWSIVSSPNATPLDVLSGVVALASNNVWAVGMSQPSASGGIPEPLIEHYDGMAWSIVSSPTFSNGAMLYGVAADAANDVWAVGNYTDSSGNLVPLTEHYNGTSWSTVTAASATTSDVLSSVSVVSGQAFAVGYSGDRHTLAEHYVSGTWSVMTTPESFGRALALPYGGIGGYVLNSVVALSPTNVWAVGDSLSSSNLSITGVIEHYDGSSWSLVANGSTLPTYISGASQVPGTTNLWAVGSYGTTDTTTSTFAEQWQGSVWNSATVAAPANSTSQLNAVAAVSSTNAWAVGFTQDLTSGAEQPLIEHYAGPPAQLFCR